MYEYLLDNGMTREEYHFFLERSSLRHHCIMGNDYYVTNEHRVAADGSTRAAGEVFGYDEITRQYYDRYKLPVMHTETNLDGGAERRRGRQLALEAMGERAARSQSRRADRRLHLVLADRPDGLGHRLARGERPCHTRSGSTISTARSGRSGAAYKQLIRDWREVLPAQSVCLTVPLVLPSEYDEPVAHRQREKARQFRLTEPDRQAREVARG